MKTFEQGIQLNAFADTEPLNEPRIGVLIPAYNEEPVMDGTIDSLLAAGFDKENIYIVDDRSTDRTAEICRNRGVGIFTVPVNGGKAKAQIQALAHFKIMERYDWIIFLDGDTKISADFADVMTSAAKKDPTVALYLGQVKSVKNNHIFSAQRAFDYTYGQDVAKTGQHNFNVIIVAPGCASMYRTDVLAKLQIDHMTLAEDMDLTMQVHRAGGRVSYLKEAIVHTQDPATFKDYHKQTLRWYRGFWQVALKHRIFSIFKKKQRIDWYMIMMAVDAIIFNHILWLIIILFGIGPKVCLIALSIDLVMAGAITFYVAWRTKRLDVIYKFPVYYWMNFIIIYAYLRAFIEIVVLRKELLAWNKVERYSFDDAVQE